MEESQNPTLVAPELPPDRAADEDWSGRAVGEFHILRRIGRGGMGQVFLAEQTSLKRKVAIKMLRPDLVANKTALQRFHAEAEAVAKLNHPNIVQIYAIGDQDGQSYMALEYVEGRNLRDYLNRKGPPDLSVCLSVMRQVAAALQRAHEGGFIHRDVKPENILVTRKGEVKVTDFGLSRCFTETGQQLNITQSGVAMGTPLYMSPEQVQGIPADPRSDIYSFGVTCFHLFAGQPPFRGANAFDVALQHVQNQPPALASIRPDLPADIVQMVHRLMAKDPEDRYASFKDVLRELNKMRENLNGAAQQLTIAGSGVFSSSATAPVDSLFDTMAAPPLRDHSNKWLGRIVIAALVIGLVLGGVGVRLLKNRLTGKGTAADAEQADKLQPVVSTVERLALEEAKQWADPDTSNTRLLKKGMDFQIDLAVIYFKKGRLDDADKFFRDLAERKYKPSSYKVHPYEALGKLGHAIVLAFRDKSDEALSQMGSLIQVQNRLGGIGPQPAPFTVAGIPGNLFENPDLRRLVVDALDRIAKNLKVEKFEKHPQLDTFRKPPPAPFKPFRPAVK